MAVSEREYKQDVFVKIQGELKAVVDGRERELSVRQLAVVQQTWDLSLREVELAAQKNLESAGLSVVMTPESSEYGEDWDDVDKKLEHPVKRHDVPGQ